MALHVKPETGAGPTAPAEKPPESPLTFSQWLVAVLLGIFFLGLTALAVRHVELVTGRYVTTGVPPVPAVAALLVLVLAGALLRKLSPRVGFNLALDRRQILLVFSMMCIGVVVNGQYAVRAFLPHLVSLQYWPSRNNSSLARWVEYLPAWYAPADAEALRRYFEGARGAGVPWHLWAVPLLRWSLFFLAVFVVAWSIAALVRRQWIHYERLSFPQLYLPLAVTGESAFDGRPLWRHPFLWCGIGAAALFNGINIAHALNPSIPAPGFVYRFSGQFPNVPWTPFNTLMLFYMLEAIGFGYFLPLEISFSTWFFYLALKFVAVAGLSAGYEAPGFPFMQDQSAGAYLGAAALLLYGARRHLAGTLRRAFAPGGGAHTAEEREEKAALFVLLGGVIFVLGWFWISGFSLLIAAPFLGVLLCFVLVYTRLRAETGVPFEFIYPYGLPKEMVVNWFTPRGILDTGGPRTWVVFSSFAWLSRHHYAQAMGAYTIDAMKLADESRVQRRWFYAALVVALVCGLALAFWSQVEAFYAVGANMAGGTGREYRASVALQEYQRMATLATTSPPQNGDRLGAQVLGAGFALLLGLLRMVFVRSPFHPLGYILATAYGDHTTIFFPMLAAWVCKSLVLKAGGLPLYRRFIPFFLGLIIGHYLIGGIFWPVFSLTLAPEARQSYHIYFGG
jgi:uncharacterized protein DUF6785/uncharacterized protein DUF6784